MSGMAGMSSGPLLVLARVLVVLEVVVVQGLEQQAPRGVQEGVQRCALMFAAQIHHCLPAHQVHGVSIDVFRT